MEILLPIYAVAVNLLSCAVCAFDKHCAVTGGRRVRERTLFLLCFVGGGVGMYATMKLIRHKTLHKRFMIGIPIIILLQAAVLIWLTKQL